MIKLLNVSKSFQNLKLIQKLNLEIYENEVTFIVGTSGSGKTTLLNMIGGLDSIDSGEILFNEVNIVSNISRYRANDVGFIFQEFNLIPGLSAKQNIQLGLLYSQKQENSNAIVNLLSGLGITNFKQKIETLSGGEKQRVAIARAVLKDSRIILADEPTGNLDSSNADKVFEILKKLKKNRHVIIVTHDVERAKKFADRIITLKDGQIESDERIGVDNCISNSSLVNSKSNKLKYKDSIKAVVMLGKNSIKRRLGRIVSISLALALAISALTMMVDLNIFGNKISNNININYLETDLLTLNYGKTLNIGYAELPFEVEQAALIKEKYNGKEIVDTYYYDFDNLQFSYGYKTQKAKLKQININGFFEERVMSSDIKGNFIQKDNEIILANDVADLLFEEDYQGKIIQLNNGFGQHVKLNVVGINSTVNPNNEIYSYLSKNIVSKLYESYLLESVGDYPLQMNKILTEETGVTVGGIKPVFDICQEDEELLFGKYPAAKNEIIMGHKELIYTLQMMNMPYNFTEQEILGGMVQAEIINNLFNESLCFSFNGYFEVKITGIYKSVKGEVRLAKELVEDIVNPQPKVLELYVDDVSKIDQIMNLISKNEQYLVMSNFKNLKDNISSQTKFYELALLALGLILALIAMVMLNSFTKITILERKDEVAIVKSLGADSKNVIGVILFDFIIIFAISIIMASIFSISYIFVLPILLSNVNYINVTYPWFLLLIVGGLFLVLLILYCLIGLRNFIKAMPAKLFKQS